LDGTSFKAVVPPQTWRFPSPAEDGNSLSPGDGSLRRMRSFHPPVTIGTPQNKELYLIISLLYKYPKECAENRK